MNGGNLQRYVNQVKRMNNLKEWPEKDIVEASSAVAQSLISVSESDLNTQVRKVLDAVRRIELEFKKSGKFPKGSVILLKPKMAYAVSRKSRLSVLMEILEPAIDKVKDEKDFQKLAAFVESVIAYHKYYTALKKNQGKGRG